MVVLATETSSQRLYSSILNAVGAAARVLTTDEVGRYGWSTGVEIWGAQIFCYAQGATGELIYLNPSSWFYGGDTMPVAMEPTRPQGMGYTEYYYATMCVLGCNSPARNVLYTGIT